MKPIESNLFYLFHSSSPFSQETRRENRSPLNSQSIGVILDKKGTLVVELNEGMNSFPNFNTSLHDPPKDRSSLSSVSGIEVLIKQNLKNLWSLRQTCSIDGSSWYDEDYEVMIRLGLASIGGTLIGVTLELEDMKVNLSSLDPSLDHTLNPSLELSLNSTLNPFPGIPSSSSSPSQTIPDLSTKRLKLYSDKVLSSNISPVMTQLWSHQGIPIKETLSRYLNLNSLVKEYAQVGLPVGNQSPWEERHHMYEIYKSLFYFKLR